MKTVMSWRMKQMKSMSLATMTAALSTGAEDGDNDQRCGVGDGRGLREGGDVIQRSNDQSK